MNPFTVNPVGPATLNALSALQPLKAPGMPVGGNQGHPVSSTAQDLFQTTLQQVTLSAVGQSATGVASLFQEPTVSLFAALAAPQAAANTSPTPDLTTNSAASPAPDATPTTTATTPTAPVEVPTTAPDAAANDSSAQLALQTAMRFGAGVIAQGPSPVQAPNLGTGLIRDPLAVQRSEIIQPRSGGPGPEAFGKPQPANKDWLKSYETVTAAVETHSMDLKV